MRPGHQPELIHLINPSGLKPEFKLTEARLPFQGENVDSSKTLKTKIIRAHQVFYVEALERLTWKDSFYTDLFDWIDRNKYIILDYIQKVNVNFDSTKSVDEQFVQIRFSVVKKWIGSL